MRVLTDRGSEYCGNPERHEYELYLAVEDVAPHARDRLFGPVLWAQRLGHRSEKGGVVNRRFAGRLGQGAPNHDHHTLSRIDVKMLAENAVGLESAFVDRSRRIRHWP